MTKRMVTAALAALILGGCQPASEQNAAANSAAEPANADDVSANEVGNELETGNVMETVLAMSDRQRNVTFIRAILDAGLKCESVRSSERLPNQGGQATWRADCGENNSHIISIAADGTATVHSRVD